MVKLDASRIFSVVTLSAMCAVAHAQSEPNFPVRNVRLIVPVPPGGSSDGMARILSQRLAEIWPQQVIVDNRAGGGGVIGSEIVARSNPDGHTLILQSLRFSVNPSLMKLPFDTLRDFQPITMTAAVGNVLVVNPKSSIMSVKDLIAEAKAKPQALTFASSGVGGAPHLIGEFFSMTTGVKMTHVPYKGGGPAMTDLVGGNVSLSFASTTSAIGFIKAGRLRALAVSSKERSRQLPEVPTMGEAGVPNLIVRDWQGIMSARNTPPAIVDKIYRDVVKVLRDPVNQDRFASLGLEVIASTPAEFGADVVSEVARWAKVVKAANIKAE